MKKAEVEFLCSKNGVEVVHGAARFQSDRSLRVETDDGSVEIEFSAAVIATGSTPIEIPIAAFDGDRIVDSSGALAFDAVPKRLGVIGAGVIGLELGSVWARLGAEVTILEAMDDFLFMADRDIAKVAAQAFAASHRGNAKSALVITAILNLYKSTRIA